ncbi:MAG: hypothetical protein GYB65_18210 [Chloroflexi bacterium]|nr:hypothetical protein [Chloroflexota bacterium]
MHEKTALLLLHKDDPEVVLRELENIAEIIRLSSQIEGEHQAKAIRLGLDLTLEYWLQTNRMDDWLELIVLLLSAARDIKDDSLRSQVFQAWGVYLYMTQQSSRAVKALEAALATAQEAGRKDLELLIKAERFNVESTDLPREKLDQTAQQLLDDARQLNHVYVRGRIYLSLARAYRKAGLTDDIFIFAQQALLCFNHEQAWAMAGAAINLMLGSLQSAPHACEQYIQRLLAYLTQLADSSINPRFKASTCYHHALRSFHHGCYDDARRHILQARRHYRSINDANNLISTQHMLGLIQTKRHCWNLAESYLSAAAAYYRRQGETVWELHAHNAIACIPLEQGYYDQALDQLQVLLRQAWELNKQEPCDDLCAAIQRDIDTARQHCDRLPGGV